MNLPRVIIVSTVRGKANEIASQIGGEKISSTGGFECYIWKIDNKYYKTAVLLCVTENPCTGYHINGVEALIVHHDPNAENADELLGQWNPLIFLFAEADVLLFSCSHVSDAATRDKVIKWCLHRKFELIEWNNSSDPTDNYETDSDHNKYGVDRIIEALHAHMWPNMTLKGKPASLEEPKSDVNEVEEQLEGIQLSESSERLQVESVLDGIMGNENADFGELFSQLMAMKEHAASLPSNQRRIAAEQLVTAFWKSMGGDPSEIDD